MKENDSTLNYNIANNYKKANTPNYALRRRVAIGLAALSLFGAGAGGRALLKGSDNPDSNYNPNAGGRTYPGYNMGIAIIPEGGGALDAVRQVDPRTADNAWKSPEAEKRLEDLEEYIKDQALGGINGSHILQAGQEVEVPVIDPLSPYFRDPHSDK